MRALAGMVVLIACGDHHSALDAGRDSASDSTPDAAMFACPPDVAVPLCSVDHLCWYATLPQGQSFVAASGGGCDYWLAGESQYIYRLNKTALTRMAVPVGQGGIYATQVFSPADAWVVGNGVGVQHFDGASWTRLTMSGQLYGSIWGASPDDVWISSDSGMDHWNGQTITTVFSTTNGIGQVAGTSANDVWAIANPMMRFDGATWTAQPKPAPSSAGFPIAIWGSDPNTWYAAVNDVGSIMTTSSIWGWDGTAWSQVYSEAHPINMLTQLVALGGSGPSDVWAAGWNLDHAVHFDGTTWSTVPVTASGAFVNAIRGTPGGDVVLAGANGYLARWDGTILTELSTSTGESGAWNGAWGSSASDVWIVGDGGHTRHFDGTAWTDQPLLPVDLNAVTGTSATDVWAGGTGARVYHWTGSAWTSTSLAITTYISSMYAAATNDVWAVGDKGLALHYDGMTWTKTTTPSTGYLHAVWGNATEAWMIDNTTATLYHWANGSWVAVAAPSTAPFALWGRSATEVYLGDVFGKLFRWDGSVWTMVSSAPGLVSSIGGDATRMWTVQRGANFDDGTGLRFLDSQSYRPLRAGYFPSGTDGWLVGEGGMILRYQP